MKKRLLQLVPFLLAIFSVAGYYLSLTLLAPFRSQTQSHIEWAYFLGSWQGFLGVAFLTLGVMLVFYLWPRSPSVVYRIGLVVCLCFLVASAILSLNENPTSRMFERLNGGQYVEASEAEHVADEEMVMGLAVDGQAVAYPVKMVSYHHIINERLGDEPYVVTY